MSAFELKSPTWAQIDRAAGVWRIPAANSKSKQVQLVPLNDSAFAVGQLNTEGTFNHLFINRRSGKPYGTIMKVRSRLRTMANLKRLRTPVFSRATDRATPRPARHLAQAVHAAG